MKKIIALLIVAIMCLSFVACGTITKDNNVDSGDNTNIITGEDNAEAVLTEKEGIVCIREDKFSDILERVELTTENWKDYIRYYSYDEKIVYKDDFGEIISTETVAHYCLGAGNERYHQFQDVVLELKNKETGELTTYNFELFGHTNTYDVSMDFNLDDYECTRIKGRIYFVDIPMEALHSPLPDWGYDTGFFLCTEYSTTPYQVDAATKGISRNGSGSWDDFFE